MILDKVSNTIKKYQLIGKGDKVVVGVSGGPDSVALLYLLNRLKKELKLTLYIAHLDHGLRKDSYKDKEFVKNLSQKLKIPITAAKINVKALAKKGSLEEIARNARLGFLFKVAKDVKAHKIALGHNFDDQAETVLMRILRGAGLYGLSGILPKRNISGFQIIRPLIEVKRKEIEAYLKKKKIKPCRDKTNLEEIYFRNKVRNRLLPLLEREYNKNIKQILSNMAESAGYDYDYLTQIAKKSIKNSQLKIDTFSGVQYAASVSPWDKPRSLERGQTRVDLKKFLNIHPSIQRLILRLLIARVKGDMRQITFQHIREIEDMVLNRPVNSVVDLPKGVSVVKKKKYLSFYRKNN